MPIDWMPLVDLVKANQRFVLTSHVRPDADALGSEMGLAGILEALGKTVRIINPPPVRTTSPFWIRRSGSRSRGGGLDRAGVRHGRAHRGGHERVGRLHADLRKVLEKTAAKKVVIDHHVSSDDLGAVEFKDTTASATGVLISSWPRRQG